MESDEVRVSKPTLVRAGTPALKMPRAYAVKQRQSFFYRIRAHQSHFPVILIEAITTVDLVPCVSGERVKVSFPRAS